MCFLLLLFLNLNIFWSYTSLSQVPFPSHETLSSFSKKQTSHLYQLVEGKWVFSNRVTLGISTTPWKALCSVIVQQHIMFYVSIYSLLDSLICEHFNFLFYMSLAIELCPWFFSDNLFLVCRNTTEFYRLILCPEPLLNALISHVVCVWVLVSHWWIVVLCRQPAPLRGSVGSLIPVRWWWIDGALEWHPCDSSDMACPPQGRA